MSTTNATAKVPVIHVSGPVSSPGYRLTRPNGETCETTAEEVAARVASAVKSRAGTLRFVFLLLVVGVAALHFFVGDQRVTIAAGSLSMIVVALTLVLSARAARFIIAYDLDDPGLLHAANAIDQLGESLQQTRVLWKVIGSTDNYDYKRNAGIGTFVDRRKVRCRRRNARWPQSNVSLWSVTGGAETLILLPECVVVASPARTLSVPYSSVSCLSESEPFVEYSRVPADAEIIGTTWQYVNKSGGPDRRFNNNRQIPRVLYGKLTLDIAGRTTIEYLVSSLELANMAESALDSVLDCDADVELDSELPASSYQPGSEDPLTSIDIVRYADTMLEVDMKDFLELLSHELGAIDVTTDVSSVIEPLIALRELQEELVVCGRRTLDDFSEDAREEVSESLTTMFEGILNVAVEGLKGSWDAVRLQAKRSGPQRRAWQVLARELKRIFDDPSRARRFDETRVLDMLEPALESAHAGAAPAASQPPPSGG